MFFFWGFVCGGIFKKSPPFFGVIKWEAQKHWETLVDDPGFLRRHKKTGVRREGCDLLFAFVEGSRSHSQCENEGGECTPT